jgi:hypothetical protein
MFVALDDSPDRAYRYRPYTTAGTPEPRVYGSAGAFVTAPASRSGGGSSSGGGTTTGGGSTATGPAESAPLFVAYIKVPNPWRMGRKLRLGYVSSEAGNAQLNVFRRTRGGYKRVARLTQKAVAGRNGFSLRTHHAGVYRFGLSVTDGASHTARDSAHVRFVRPRRRARSARVP